MAGLLGQLEQFSEGLAYKMLAFYSFMRKVSQKLKLKGRHGSTIYYLGNFLAKNGLFCSSVALYKEKIFLAMISTSID